MLNRRHFTALATASLWPLAGRAQASVHDDTWHDAARQRALPLRIRVPAGPGPWPVLLYSHGLGGSREGADAWGSAWAAAGFLVLHLQHAGSDIAAIRSGLRAAANAEQWQARVGDVRFALDELARRQAAGDAQVAQARLDAVGMVGHSFGAHTTLAVAGQRYGVALDMTEPRLKAFVALSPSPAPARLVPQRPFGAITRPLLCITGSLDGDPFGSYSTGEQRAQVFDGLPPGQRALLWLDGADHMTFAGNAQQRINGRGPFARAAVAREREEAHHTLVARITTLWWRWRLLGDATARMALVAPPGLAEKDRWQLG